MLLTVQPVVRAAPARSRCSGAAPRRVAPTCSLRERAGVAFTAAALAATLAAPPAFAKAADFGVYWLSPDDGATLASPVAAKFGVKGLDVKPAGARPLPRERRLRSNARRRGCAGGRSAEPQQRPTRRGRSAIV